MVSSSIVTAGVAGFFVAFCVPILYVTWVSLRDDRHSPASLRADAEEN